jgi:hypothetical protein
MVRRMSASPASRPIVARRRVLLLGALVLLLAGAAIAVLIIKPWASTLAAAQPTVWQEITGGITNGQVPKDVALEAFAYLYRVSIPGVQVPAGREGGDGPTSGTGATRWVQAHWDELTPD